MTEQCSVCFMNQRIYNFCDFFLEIYCDQVVVGLNLFLPFRISDLMSSYPDIHCIYTPRHDQRGRSKGEEAVAVVVLISD